MTIDIKQRQPKKISFLAVLFVLTALVLILAGGSTVARKYNKVMQAVANICEIAHLTHKAETWSRMDRMNTELQIVSNH